MATTSDRMRAWTGPALFSYGFRPFFLGAGVWAVLSACLWLALLSGTLALPTRLDPVSWHAHEFLFGYLGAVLAGFMMTAVPNWTGRMPIVGWPLMLLFTLWLVSRLAMGVSALLPAGLGASVDGSFLLVLALVMLREIVAGRNWRNLGVVALLGVFLGGNVLFHVEAARGGYAAGGLGLRIGLGAALMMIALIGGRIVPSFTRNWLVRRGSRQLPVPPMQRLDKAALLLLLAALAAWVVRPEHLVTSALLIAAGLLNLVRVARWAGTATFPEPLVCILHAGYLFVPLGALAVALGGAMPAVLAPAAAQHLWMAGAVGVMTLAVMTRATLGHTGQPLTAGRGTCAVYALLIASVLIRTGAGLWPGVAGFFQSLSGAFWLSAFAGFSWLYGGLLIRPRQAL
ncbi:NnrS family protein [Yangia sp. PrR004]|nr:NnrS family protein [Salipiger sp. PrR004]